MNISKKAIWTIIPVATLSVMSGIYAITQSGSEGPITTATADLDINVSAVARISGLQDFDFGDISYLTASVGNRTNNNVCLYSSTGAASINAIGVDAGKNSAGFLFKNPPGVNEAASFEILLGTGSAGDPEMSKGPHTFLELSIEDIDCYDDVGKRTMTAVMKQLPKIAGTYTATVEFTMTPLEVD
jgi:spore coat protein U-like protein